MLHCIAMLQGALGSRDPEYTATLHWSVGGDPSIQCYAATVHWSVGNGDPSVHCHHRTACIRGQWGSLCALLHCRVQGPGSRGQWAVGSFSALPHYRGHWVVGILLYTTAASVNGIPFVHCHTARATSPWAMGILEYTAALQGAVGSGDSSVHCHRGQGAVGILQYPLVWQCIEGYPLPTAPWPLQCSSVQVYRGIPSAH